MSPRPPTRRRRALLAAPLAALAALLVLAPLAGADPLTPENGGSPNADRIDTLYKITFYLGVVVFLFVEGLLIFSLVRHRHRRGGPVPQQVRGNTRLELGWTIGAALILVVLAAVTFAMLPGIRNPEESGPNGLQQAAGVQFAAKDQPRPPGGNELRITVVGQQYLWRYDYPGRERVFSYYNMVVPVNTTVTLEITSQDVQHSYWVPKLFGKADAVPGHVNRTWFKATRPGVYPGNCAELCGENHAQMLNTIEVMPVDRYRAWYARQAQDIKEAQTGLADQRRQREGASNETP